MRTKVRGSKVALLATALLACASQGAKVGWSNESRYRSPACSFQGFYFGGSVGAQNASCQAQLNDSTGGSLAIPVSFDAPPLNGLEGVQMFSQFSNGVVNTPQASETFQGAGFGRDSHLASSMGYLSAGALQFVGNVKLYYLAASGKNFLFGLAASANLSGGTLRMRGHLQDINGQQTLLDDNGIPLLGDGYFSNVQSGSNKAFMNQARTSAYDVAYHGTSYRPVDGGSFGATFDPSTPPPEQAGVLPPPPTMTAGLSQSALEVSLKNRCVWDITARFGYAPSESVNIGMELGVAMASCKVSVNGGAQADNTLYLVNSFPGNAAYLPVSDNGQGIYLPGSPPFVNNLSSGGGGIASVPMPDWQLGRDHKSQSLALVNVSSGKDIRYQYDNTINGGDNAGQVEIVGSKNKFLTGFVAGFVADMKITDNVILFIEGKGTFFFNQKLHMDLSVTAEGGNPTMVSSVEHLKNLSSVALSVGVSYKFGGAPHR